jgi:hypothetical protein
MNAFRTWMKWVFGNESTIHPDSKESWDHESPI